MPLFSTTCIDLPLRPRWISGLFVALSALIVLAGSAEAMKIATVAALEKSTQISKVRIGLAIDPDNAALHNRLSQLHVNSLENSYLTAAIAHARRATEVNPNKSDYWLTLASACESVRNDSCADQALQHALVLSPMVPLVWWVAGNQYLRAGRSEVVLSCFRHLLDLSPDYAAPVFDLTLHTYGDSKLILENFVRSGKDAHLGLALVDFLIAKNDFDSANQAWAKTVSRGARFPLGSIQPYLERLMVHGRYQEAQKIWIYLEAHGIIEKPSDSEMGNLVFNGGFEHLPVGAGFDWNSPPEPYVSVDFAASPALEGLHCLRLDFPVSQNDEFEPVCQIFPVVGNQAYILTAYVRSSDITSNSGPRLRVMDTDCPSCLNAATEATVGSTPWHKVTLKFFVGPQTPAVRVSIWRPRSRAFPMDISGSFWLDAVSVRADQP